MPLSCFKAYDIRGQVGRDLDEGVCRRIGRGFAEVLRPGSVVVGRDPRESSEAFVAALSRGLGDAGVEVLDLGLCGTEEVYFATATTDSGGGIMVTASHNPISYNGMKLVGPGSRPLTGTEFSSIAAVAADVTAADGPDMRLPLELRDRYARHVCGFVADAAGIADLRLLANFGNGAAGPTFAAIVEELDRQGNAPNVVRLFPEPDGRFPNGIPNPLLRENRGATSAAVIDAGASLGIAWDGDFDRCFFFDGAGRFVEGEYVVAMLAESVLAREPGATIIHDPRIIWATQDAVARRGGHAVVSRTGHAHLKAAMRAEEAAYGGEMSAHHYFRDFAYCDSGMIPWLLVAARMGELDAPLEALVEERRQRFPSSGEINFSVDDPGSVIERVVDAFGDVADNQDRMDGVSLSFPDWRMNLRASNTEPLLRLNVETRADPDLLAEKVRAISDCIGGSRRN
jgi:phosphomannomutase